MDNIKKKLSCLLAIVLLIIEIGGIFVANGITVQASETNTSVNEEEIPLSGLNKNSNGVWCYYTDGDVDTSYTGLVEYKGKTFYVLEGIVNFEADGLTKINGVWYYLDGGILQSSYIGLVEYSGKHFYVVNGKIDFTADGLTKINSTWYYLDGGIYQSTYTGLVKYSGKYFYVVNGKIDFSADGLTKINGTWYYLDGGIYLSTYTGLVSYSGKAFYVVNGKIDFSADGLTKINGTWYYLDGGILQSTYTGLVKYSGKHFYVVNGKIDFSADGLTKINGIWYYLEGGIFQSTYTGLVEYNGNTFYVENGKLGVGTLTGVKLNKTSVSLNPKETVTLVATMVPANVSNKSVTWSSSNTAVATVSSAGVVTAVANGTATITVKTVDGSKTATCTVTVTTVPTGVTLNKTSVALNPDGTATLTATVTPSTASNKSVTWSSSNTAVATVSSTGVVTAVANGTATITVKTADGSKTATCKVTVTTPVTGINIVKDKVFLDVNDSSNNSYQCEYAISPTTASNKNVTWTSSDTSIATVDSTGKITAKTIGKATITVTTTDGSKSDTVSVFVYKSDPDPRGGGNWWLKLSAYSNANLVMTESGKNVYLNEYTGTDEQLWQFGDYTEQYGGMTLSPRSRDLVLKPLRIDGSLKATCSMIVWDLTADPDASVWQVLRLWDESYVFKLTDDSGNEFAVGTTSVTSGTQLTLVDFDFGDVKQRWNIEGVYVEPTVPVTGVSITNKKDLPLDWNDSSNKTYQCTVTVSPSDASNTSIIWTSSDTSVATVSSTGFVTAIARGTATITATTSDGGYTDSFIVYVYKSNAATPTGGTIYYKIRSAANYSYLFDVYNGTTSNGTKVQLMEDTSDNAQYWQFHDYTSEHGGIAIVPKCNTGAFILDANRGSNYTDPLKAGCLIDLWTLGEDDAASMWQIIRLWDDTYIFRLINSNLVVAASSITTGTQLVLKEFDVFDTSQRWCLQAVDFGSSSSGTDYTSKLNSLKSVSGYKSGDVWSDNYSNYKACGNACWSAIECHGWALTVGYKISGTCPVHKWAKVTDMTGVKTGDIIRYQYSDGTGHTIVVISVSGDTITYADCNGNGGYLKIAWDQKVSKSANVIFGYPFAYRMVAP